MARKKKRRSSRRRGGALGHNADASHAIKLARQGKCDLAWRYVIEAGAHNYPKQGDQDDAHLARVIVNQHCGKARTKRSKRTRQAYPYWGARSRKRKRSR